MTSTPDHRTNHVLRKPSLLTLEVPEAEGSWRRNVFFREANERPDFRKLENIATSAI
jgi:hypothetical protein